MLEVGLVGYGFSGRTFHAPVISAVEGLRLSAVVRRSGEQDPELPEIAFVRSLDELLARKSIHLVVVATPNTSHFEIARESLLAGKHVVIDKPFATTYSEAAELANLARERGRVLSVYQNRRWDGDFRTVQKLVRERALGELVRYESNFDRFRPELRPEAWRERAEAGAGVLFDLGAHLIDQAHVLFGTPDSIYADVRRERAGALVDDAFDVMLRYPKLRVVLGATVLAASPPARFRLLGTDAAYTKYGLDPQEDALKAGERPASNWGEEDASAYGEIATATSALRMPTMAGDYRAYYANVRDSILGRTELAVTPQQALNVMRVLELSLESSHTGRVVPFPKGS